MPHDPSTRILDFNFMITTHQSLLLLGSALLSLAVAPLPAAARPFLYMSSFDYSGSYKQCITNAEKVLRTNGFDRDLEVREFAEDRAAEVYGFKNDEAIIAEIQCIQKAGLTLLGVAGLDNETTWEVYDKLRKATW